MAAYTTIDDPSAHFHTLLWTGNGADNRALTNDANAGDFKPDWVWVKARSAAEWNNVYDSSRGANKSLYPNSTYQEESLSQTLESFDTNGFTVSYNSAYSSVFTNKNSTTYVGWQWKANGGTTTSVSASGTGNHCINACTHQANTDAGFSIITYTGRDDQLNNGNESKLTHGLGVAPKVLMLKRRDAADDWYYMGGDTATVRQGWYNGFLSLNDTDTVNGNHYVSSTLPDSTHIYLGNQKVNIASASYIGYAFAEKQGFSKFSRYVGNGNADGPFIYTGFQPAFVMIKGADVADDWYIFDNKRAGHNPEVFRLRANTAGTETTGTNNTVDHLSNGFKLRFPGGSINGSGSTYIYMAFAEQPFVTSTGVPATAR